MYNLVKCVITIQGQQRALISMPVKTALQLSISDL